MPASGRRVSPEEEEPRPTRPDGTLRGHRQRQPPEPLGSKRGPEGQGVGRAGQGLAGPQPTLRPSPSWGPGLSDRNRLSPLPWQR